MSVSTETPVPIKNMVKLYFTDFPPICPQSSQKSDLYFYEIYDLFYNSLDIYIVTLISQENMRVIPYVMYCC